MGSPYSTNVSVGVLVVQVGVISGSLQIDVVLNISTMDIKLLLVSCIKGVDRWGLGGVAGGFSPHFFKQLL